MRARFLVPLGAVIVVCLIGGALLWPSEDEAEPKPATEAKPVDRPSPPTPPAPEPVKAAEPEAPTPHTPTDFRAARRALAAQPSESPSAEPVPVLPPAPAPAEWSQVPVVSPFGQGSPAPAVTKAMGALKPRLARCFEPETQASWGRLGPAFSRLGDSARQLGPAILMLEVESDGSSTRILDAPAEARGSASDGALNCAQAALRGVELPVGTLEPRRFRMRFPLRP